MLSPIAYAWVECLPQVILERRARDSTRIRDEETQEELQMHQDLTRSFLTACCMHTGSLLCCVQNNGTFIDQNVLPLIQLIKSL